MVVRRTAQCMKCRDYMNLYLKEREPLKGKQMTCKCGSTYKCIKEFQGVTKWREI